MRVIKKIKDSDTPLQKYTHSLGLKMLRILKFKFKKSLFDHERSY